MKRLMAMCAAAVLTGGCFNLTVRPQTDVNQGPYFCTKMDQAAIRRGWNGNYPIAKMLLPVFVVDWPFEAVCDTIFWPWDFVMDGRHGVAEPSRRNFSNASKPTEPGR